ncbi:MAG: hypothetical protein ACOCXD_03290 [Bacteroidota bacterium]
MVEVFIISILLVVIALIGLSVRVIFKKNGEFSGGSCRSTNPRLDEKGLSCGCEDKCEREYSLE